MEQEVCVVELVCLMAKEEGEDAIFGTSSSVCGQLLV